MAWEWTVGRIIGSAVLSAVLGTIVNLGGVWVVVQTSVSGLQTAIEATNGRLGNVEAQLLSLNDKIFALNGDVQRGFRETKAEVQKKASLEIPIGGDEKPERFASGRDPELIPRLFKAKAITDSLLSEEPATLFVPTNDAFANSNTFQGFMSNGKTDPKKLDALVKAYRVPGAFTLETLQKFAAKSNMGLTFQTEDGRTIRAMVVDGKVSLTDDKGTAANVVGSAKLTNTLNVVSMDGVWK